MKGVEIRAMRCIYEQRALKWWHRERSVMSHFKYDRQLSTTLSGWRWILKCEEHKVKQGRTLDGNVSLTLVVWTFVERSDGTLVGKGSSDATVRRTNGSSVVWTGCLTARAWRLITKHRLNKQHCVEGEKEIIRRHQHVPENSFSLQTYQHKTIE